MITLRKKKNIVVFSGAFLLASASCAPWDSESVGRDKILRDYLGFLYPTPVEPWSTGLVLKCDLEAVEGMEASFRVRMIYPPPESMVVNFQMNPADSFDASRGSLTFTPENFFDEQSVTIVSVDNYRVMSDHEVRLEFTGDNVVPSDCGIAVTDDDELWKPVFQSGSYENPSVAVDPDTGISYAAATEVENSTAFLNQCDSDLQCGSEREITSFADGLEPDTAVYGESWLTITVDQLMGGLLLKRCDLTDTDGQNCDSTTISLETLQEPEMIVDEARKRLYVVARFSGYPVTEDTPFLIVCNATELETDIARMDCSEHDIQLDAPLQSGFSPDVVIDRSHNRIFVVATEVVSDSESRLNLFACDLNVAGDLLPNSCSYRNLSVPSWTDAARNLSLDIDERRSRLLIVGRDASANRLFAYHCKLENMELCSSGIISSEDELREPAMILDQISGLMLLATRNKTQDNKPFLLICDPAKIDGVNPLLCDARDISGGREANSGFQPDVAIDSLNGNVVVIARDNAISGPGSAYFYRFPLP